MSDFITVINNIKSSTFKSLTNTNWKLFKISDYFNVECSKYHNPDNYESGKIPYVARTTFNNGVVSFVQTTEQLYDGNCIIIGAESAQAFYQKEPFITGNKVYRIYETDKSKLNKEIALFLCTLLNKEGKKYSYANAWISDKVKDTELLLPAINNSDGTFSPDWNYMENYIKNIFNFLHIDLLISIKNNQKNILLQHNDTSSWKFFKISDYFDVVLSRGDNQIKNLQRGNIPLVSATSENNGIVGFIKNGDGKSQLFSGNSITVDMFGKSFYQKNDFYSVSHGRVNILIPLFNLNQEIAFFIITSLKYLGSKYSYSEMCTSKKLENEEILLPSITNLDGTFSPDWNYMENYIKNLQNEIFK